MIARAGRLAILGASLAMPAMISGQPAIDPAVVLTDVEIEQRPPFRPTNVGARDIVIRFRVTGPPACAAAAPPTYTLLLDAFPWRRSHVDLPAFPELRFQSAIAVRCGDDGRFISNIKGTVSVEPSRDASGATITLQTTFDQLPAVEFRWIAVASNGSDFTRAPVAGKYARWAIHERTLR